MPLTPAAVDAYPTPQGGASLLLAFSAPRAVLVVGSNALAASRAFAALEADYTVTIMAHDVEDACDEVRWRIDRGEVNFVNMDTFEIPPPCASPDRGVQVFASYLDSSNETSLVFVTDTVLGGSSTARRSRASAAQLHSICRARRVPVNVTDMPDLCDFTFASTHRFVDSKEEGKTPLQIGVVTNGQGCRLSTRIRRDIVSKLPQEVGVSVAKIGTLRRLAKEASSAESDEPFREEDRTSTPNTPVPQRREDETALEATRRRMKWVSQVSEFYSYSHLAKMDRAEMEHLLGDGPVAEAGSRKARVPSYASGNGLVSLHNLEVPAPAGRIFLVGSGPGHPGLLTIATRDVLTRHADLVLTDKLVPEEVLALIPPDVEVRVARKFPGNAEGAQQEMMEAAVEAAQRGLTVVRLKQGDPTVYGRAGEEVLYFRAHGFESVLIPGVSSALAGPVFAGIPVTQRGAAESFTVCTGVGRQGKEVTLPGYERARTLVVLMGVARLTQVLDTLLSPECARRAGTSYPAHTPIAIIERASMPDQRVIASTLVHIGAALESAGPQRPPGMIIIGWAVPALWGDGELTVLDEGAESRDGERVRRWLDGKRWRVTEGFISEWAAL
ncbi:uroporphyrin-III C-m [Auriscalpium vulgare]|uniref:Uroporphyrin-III C-m n=1 Tax=Auriscalpium vulgare TaxID=40419 RepID=A0ACB8SAW4_9AGAM|nr:uroporphyrin-III C-m [Auriscalpium vulgare]